MALVLADQPDRDVKFWCEFGGRKVLHVTDRRPGRNNADLLDACLMQTPVQWAGKAYRIIAYDDYAASYGLWYARVTLRRLPG